MTCYVFPGQGSQAKGMGQSLFHQYRDLVEQANVILGYSIEEMCSSNPDNKLFQTQYTQPCLFFVNVLSYLEHCRNNPAPPKFMAGHSLGEFNALYAAGAFNLETALRVVQKRGELMSQAKSGAMAAVLGKNGDQVSALLTSMGASTIDVANYNSSTQVVISGPKADIINLHSEFEKIDGVRYIPLPVSAAFHSRYMKEASEQFSNVLDMMSISPLENDVISNVTARPYIADDVEQIRASLVKQIVSPVNWTESIRYLMGQGEQEFIELGPGTVLTKLNEQIQREESPLILPAERKEPSIETSDPASSAISNNRQLYSQTESSAENNNITNKVTQIQPASSSSLVKREISAEMLGSKEFRQDYNLKYAYLSGSMYKGIASADMVVAMGKAGMMGFLGTGGMPTKEIESNIDNIQRALPNGEAFGINLLNNIDRPEQEDELVQLLLNRGVTVIEASAFMHITPALVWYRLKGAVHAGSGEVIAPNSIIAKVSRPEIAEQFMSPAPKKILTMLTQKGLLTPQEAKCGASIPLAHDICVEADSGGHTDKGVAYTLLPAIQSLRDRIMTKLDYKKRIRVGSAGGIGTPEAAAAAFMLGADFILTGSINQCTVEAGTSSEVKDLLQSVNVNDTAYAPSGDMFELGAQIQVLKKGLFFPARANKLFDLYRQYNSIDELDNKTRQQLETKFFKRSIEQVWEETSAYYARNNPVELRNAEKNPKLKMTLIFKWYFVHTSRLALSGSSDQKVDYQIHAGPAIGAFNQWVKGTLLEDWKNRHVDNIGKKLMHETAELLTARVDQLFNSDDNIGGLRGQKSA